MDAPEDLDTKNWGTGERRSLFCVMFSFAKQNDFAGTVHPAVKGLAMGADRGILVVDEENRASSPQAVASVLAEVLKQEDFDLILAGTQSDHYSYAETGVILAELLGLPHATIVMEIEARPAEKTVKALREMESGAFQWVEMPLPAVLAIQAGISKVRYASLKGIMQAKKKEIRKINLGDLAIDLDSIPRLEINRHRAVAGGVGTWFDVTCGG